MDQDCNVIIVDILSIISTHILIYIWEGQRHNQTVYFYFVSVSVWPQFTRYLMDTSMVEHDECKGFVWREGWQAAAETYHQQLKGTRVGIQRVTDRKYL